MRPVHPAEEVAMVFYLADVIDKDALDRVLGRVRQLEQEWSEELAEQSRQEREARAARPWWRRIGR